MNKKTKKSEKFKKTDYEYAMELEAIRADVEKSKAEEFLFEVPDANKTEEAFSCAAFILLAIMSLVILVGINFFDTNIMFGIGLLFLAVIYFTFRFFQRRVSTVIASLLFLISGFFAFKDNIMLMSISFLGTIVFIILSDSVIKTIPLIRLLRKTKPMKQVCTEKVSVKCLNTYEKNIYFLKEYNIEVIPRYGIIKTHNKTKTKNVYYLLCPVYELDYKGVLYTLYDNYYGLNNPDDGEICEVLINPENPMEFYDINRYKADAKDIYRTASIIPAIIVSAFMIFIMFLIINNYPTLLDGYYQTLG